MKVRSLRVILAEILISNSFSCASGAEHGGEPTGSPSSCEFDQFGGYAPPEAKPPEQKAIRAGEPEAHRHVRRQRRIVRNL